MKKVTLYWNHICVLLNEEKKFLNKVKETLLEQNVDLEIHYFGLGSTYHMAEYIAKPDAVLPDIIVSADLEVFEDDYIYTKLGDLHACENWLALKNHPMIQACKRKETMLPFLAIPLVSYMNDATYKEYSLPQLLTQKGFAFGGINNSAGKTLVKLAIQEYGYEMCEQLLDTASIYDMPIGSFQAVRTKRDTIALVPSLYAMRADEKSTFQSTLKEGTVLLPTYFAARISVEQDIAKKIAEEVLSEQLSQVYAKNANMIVCIDHETSLKVEDEVHAFRVVTQTFLDSLDTKKFNSLYHSKIPSSKPLY